jgi:hypothetical protein
VRGASWAFPFAIGVFLSQKSDLGIQLRGTRLDRTHTVPSDSAERRLGKKGPSWMASQDRARGDSRRTVRRVECPPAWPSRCEWR